MYMNIFEYKRTFLNKRERFILPNVRKRPETSGTSGNVYERSKKVSCECPV